MAPKLRFGKFSGEWHKLNLGIASNYLKGFAFKSQDYSGQGERIIRVSDLLSDSIKTQNEKIYISKSKIDDLKKYKIKSGEIIITTVGSKPELRDSAVGRAIFVREDGIGYLNQNLLKLTANKGFNSAFIYMSISGNRYLSHIENIQRGNANQSNITVSDLLEFPLFCPNEDEQLKLGLFLTAVDAKISQLTKKHELLTIYKKGVMQKIFSQELRFKDDDGKDFSEWVKTNLGQVGKITSGVGFPNIEQGGSTGTPFYKVSDMNLSANEIEMHASNNYVSEMQIKQLRLKIIDKPAIIFAKVGAAIFLERKRIAKNFLIDNNMMAFIPSFYIGFAKFLFDSIKLSQFAQVGALPSYNSSDISIISVSIPCLDEQIKIANFLAAIDDKIMNVKAQLEAAKEYKQGLLQLMFI